MQPAGMYWTVSTSVGIGTDHRGGHGGRGRDPVYRRFLVALRGTLAHDDDHGSVGVTPFAGRRVERRRRRIAVVVPARVVALAIAAAPIAATPAAFATASAATDAAAHAVVAVEVVIAAARSAGSGSYGQRLAAADPEN
jgi:hypothetical protein